MKNTLKKLLNMQFTERTKHNEIYENDTHVLISNIVTGLIKIKPKVNQS